MGRIVDEEVIPINYHDCGGTKIVDEEGNLMQDEYWDYEEVHGLGVTEEIHHKDGDPHNNELNNLEVVTKLDTVDITPTWKAIVPILVEVAARGTSPESRKEAMSHLLHLADVVDDLIKKEKGIDV